MNKTKIEWTDYTWNPITGCLRNCWYCYATKMFGRFHKSFQPGFHPERMNEPDGLKRPAKVFVCSVSDLFASWTKEEWRDCVLRKISEEKYSHLTFQLLTKSPENIKMRFRKNIWVGTTITCEVEMHRLPSLVDHYDGMKFISFEPLLSSINIAQYENYFNAINWVIIGKLTGSNKIKLKEDWVWSIVKEAKARNIPVFMKNNLKPEVSGDLIQEFPV